VSAQDPWQILGVPPGVSRAEIRRAYRRLARRYHPDLNPDDPGAEERFKEVQAAYEALTQDPIRPEARPHPPSMDDEPFLNILAAYLRRRQGGAR
jgi:preprotein translocase subunit Sec63